jgi:putative transposase
LSAFVDEQRDEPICRSLGIATSTYYAVKKRYREPSARTLHAAELLVEVRRVHGRSRGLYGARKVWLQLRRDGIPVARCTVERLIRRDGL